MFWVYLHDCNIKLHVVWRHKFIIRKHMVCESAQLLVVLELWSEMAKMGINIIASLEFSDEIDDIR